MRVIILTHNCWHFTVQKVLSHKLYHLSQEIIPIVGAVIYILDEQIEVQKKLICLKSPVDRAEPLNPGLLRPRLVFYILYFICFLLGR